MARSLGLAMYLLQRLLRLSEILTGLPVVILTAVLFCAPHLHAQESVFTLDPSKSTIEFTLGASLHTVHGTFKLKRGEIRFDSAKGTASGAIVVDALSGDSSNESRDKKMHQEILESPKFSEIVFVPNRVQGTVAPQGTSQVTVSGVVKIHGQDHDMALTFAVQPGPLGQAQATSKFSVPYVKWGLKNPSTFLLRVTDSVDIDVHASGQLSSAPVHP
jgi:polyisoprenoid-binding protein YceI